MLVVALGVHVVSAQHRPGGGPGPGRAAPARRLAAASRRPCRIRLRLRIKPGTSDLRRHSLKGWDGDTAFWRAENGTLIGETTAENPLKANTFLIWRGGRRRTSS